MSEFDLKELPVIEPGNPAWQSVEAWAKHNLERLRETRENTKLGLRELDVALGSIHSLGALLGLPAQIKKERKRDPVEDDNFNIPAP